MRLAGLVLCATLASCASSVPADSCPPGLTLRVELRHVDATGMARSLKPGPDARVVADPRTNSIVLAGPESEVRLLERRIREADAP